MVKDIDSCQFCSLVVTLVRGVKVLGGNQTDATAAVKMFCTAVQSQLSKEVSCAVSVSRHAVFALQ